MSMYGPGRIHTRRTHPRGRRRVVWCARRVPCVWGVLSCVKRARVILRCSSRALRTHQTHTTHTLPRIGAARHRRHTTHRGGSRVCCLAGRSENTVSSTALGYPDAASRTFKLPREVLFTLRSLYWCAIGPGCVFGRLARDPPRVSDCNFKQPYSSRAGE